MYRISHAIPNSVHHIYHKNTICNIDMQLLAILHSKSYSIKQREYEPLKTRFPMLLWINHIRESPFTFWMSNCRFLLIQGGRSDDSTCKICDFLDNPHKQPEVKGNYTFTKMNQRCQAWQPVFAAWNAINSFFFLLLWASYQHCVGHLFINVICSIYKSISKSKVISGG